MKKTIITFAAALVVSLPLWGNAAQSKPNIVFILADDLGYGELGCYGATKVRTPNIDRLASEGLRFTDAHTPSAVCTPTRYALLTGRYCWRTHLKSGVAQQDEALLIEVDRYTLPRLFKQNGYATACIGKWHLGFGEKGIEANPAPDSGRISWNGELKPGPLETGFDYYFGVPINNGIAPFVYVENHRVVNLDPADPIAKLRHNDMVGGKLAQVRTEDLIVDLGAKAVSFMEAQKDKPFFLYYALCHVHLPRHPSERFKGTSEAGWPGDFIQEMDWGVGEVLAAIDRLGLKDNTIVIFTSDNGGLDIPAHNPDGPSVNRYGHKACGDLRGQKTENYEGGHRVPYIIRWPGRVPAGRTCERLISVHDMLPSFASLLGAKLPAGAAPDAVDVLPALLKGDEAPIVRTGMVTASVNGDYAYREGDWVYLDHRGGGGGSFTMKKTGEIRTGPPGQLYNLREDLAQQHNLYEGHSERVSQMKARLQEIKNGRDGQRSLAAKLPNGRVMEWNLAGKPLPMAIGDGSSILRGSEPMTLHVRATAKGGRLEGVLMSQAAPKGSEHLAFALEGWRMGFAERDHLAFHSEHPKGGTKRSLIVCADTDRLPETKTFDIVIRRKGADELEMWVNGCLTDERHWLSYSGTCAGGSVWGGFGNPLHGGKLVFGSNPDGTDPFTGTLESAAVWSHALDDAELEAIFARKLDRSHFIPESESALERMGPTEWRERELGFGRFGRVTDRAQIAERIAFFDRELLAFRERLVRDDASHFPRYHIALPGESWNNHIFFHNGRWHLFIAWSAGGNFTYFSESNREGIFWQHLSTEDWVNWTFHPWPIRTARQSDNGAFFVDDDGTAVVLYYGGNQRGRPGAARAECADPLLERWELCETKGKILGMPEKFKTGRLDPSGVFKKNDTWHLWTSCLHNVQSIGFFLPLFTSKDAVDWTYAGNFYEYDNDQGLNEGGQMATVNGKAALFFSHFMEEVPGLEHGASYLIGDIDDDGRFHAEAMGEDETGVCAATDDRGRAMVLRRAPGGGRRFQRASGEGWFRGYALPHVATLGADKLLRCAPPTELKALRAKHAGQKIDRIEAGAEVAVADGIDVRQMEVVLRIPDTGQGRQGVRLSDGECVLEAFFDQEKRQFVLDISGMDATQLNGKTRPSIRPARREGTPGLVTLRFYADRSFFDLFGDNDASLSEQAYFRRLDRVRATVFSEGAEAENLAVDAWQMNPFTFAPSPSIPGPGK